jgi:hypothetical protein
MGRVLRLKGFAERFAQCHDRVGRSDHLAHSAATGEDRRDVFACRADPIDRSGSAWPFGQPPDATTVRPRTRSFRHDAAVALDAIAISPPLRAAPKLHGQPGGARTGLRGHNPTHRTKEGTCDQVGKGRWGTERDKAPDARAATPGEGGARGWRYRSRAPLQ